MSEREDHDSDYKELSGSEGMQKIAELIHGIHIAMMTTVAKDGSMSSRPMAVQDVPFEGTLWFLTRDTSEKVDEIEADRHVLLTFAEPKSSAYLALKGRANISKDQTKIEELWSPLYMAWFPKGEHDPEIAVVRVDVVEGDYWEATSGKIVMLMKYAAAAATGGKVAVGEAGHITV